MSQPCDIRFFEEEVGAWLSGLQWTYFDKKTDGFAELHPID